MWINDEIQVAALCSQSGEFMALKSVVASGRLSGLLFEMTVRQSYRNETKRTLETVYTFPLAWGAVLLGLDVELGGKRLSGAVVKKKEAERRYENAISDGDSPILLEKSADGLYTVNLGNLKPGEDAVIEYRYAQLLHFEQGHIRVTVPTTIAPRYGDAEMQGGIRPHESVESDLLAEYPFELTLTLAGDVAQGLVQSPSHLIGTQCVDGLTVVNMDRNAWLDRDFVLTVDGLAGRSLASVAQDDEESVVMASFCPEIEGAPRSAIALKMLVDCSGSMGGDSIQAAKQALHQVLSELQPGDRISYSRFGSSVEHMFDRMALANDQGIAKAARCIERTDADMGGTEIQDALRSVFGLRNGGECSDVLLITDGEVWDTEAIIEAARQSGHRIFAVGVGSAPAETLLRRLAEATGGACELVAPNEDIEAAIVRMFRRIRLPRASNVQIQWPVTPRWATPVPGAVFDGETIYAFAAFDAPLTAAPVLSFEMEGGAHFRCDSPVPIAAEGDILARLAGNERLKHESGSSAQALALRYQLVTDQTSLFLVHVREAEDKATDLPHLQKIAHMQAAGWGGMGVVSSAPRACMCLTRDDSSPVLFSRRSKGSDNTPPTLSYSGVDDLEIPAFLRSKGTESESEALDRAHWLALFEKMLADFNARLSHPDQLSQLIHALETNPDFDHLLAIVDAIELEGVERKEAWAVFALWTEQEVNEPHRLNRHAARAVHSAAVVITKERLRAIFALINEHVELLSADGWAHQADLVVPEGGQ